MSGDAMSGPDGTQPLAPPALRPDSLDAQGRARLPGRVEPPGAPQAAARPDKSPAEKPDPPTMPVASEVIAQAGRARVPAPPAARGQAAPTAMVGGSRATTHESPRRRRTAAAWLVLAVLLALVLAYNLVRLLYTTFH
jgi:hypothetical protein